MRTATAVAVTAILLTACEREAPLPLALRAPPFHMMRDIALGMSAQDLVARHPVRFEPYQGYREEIGGYAVLYEFDDSARETPPPSRARLKAITITESDATNDAALVRYTRSVLEATRMLGKSSECRFHEASGRMITQYQLDNALFVIVLAPARTSADSAAVIRSYRRGMYPIWSAARPQGCVR